MEQIFQELGGRIQLSPLFYTLNQLEKQGVFCERGTERPTEEIALFSLQDVDAV